MQLWALIISQLVPLYKGPILPGTHLPLLYSHAIWTLALSSYTKEGQHQRFFSYVAFLWDKSTCTVAVPQMTSQVQVWDICVLIYETVGKCTFLTSCLDIMCIAVNTFWRGRRCRKRGGSGGIDNGAILKNLISWRERKGVVEKYFRWISIEKKSTKSKGKVLLWQTVRCSLDGLVKDITDLVFPQLSLLCFFLKWLVEISWPFKIHELEKLEIELQIGTERERLSGWLGNVTWRILLIQLV